MKNLVCVCALAGVAGLLVQAPAQSAIYDFSFVGLDSTQPGSYNVAVSLASVPELSTWAMLGLGFAGLGLAAARGPQKRGRRNQLIDRSKLVSKGTALKKSPATTTKAMAATMASLSPKALAAFKTRGARGTLSLMPCFVPMTRGI
jgi:hypothetical protein